MAREDAMQGCIPRILGERAFGLTWAENLDPQCNLAKLSLECLLIVATQIPAMDALGSF